MNPRDHQLFKRFPLAGTATLSTGEAPTPYHIYDGYGLFIGGTGEAVAVQQLLKAEALTPVQTTDGRAVLGLWICDFTDASLGPHHELQFSIFVTPHESAPIAPHPLNAPLLMLTRPDVQMLCHGLWNNTPPVVAYNRELLSLNARLCNSRIEETDHALRFAFTDSATDRPVLSGEVSHPRQASARANWAFMHRLGWRRGWAVTRQPWLELDVLNPLGVKLDRHAAARTYTSNAANVLRFFDPGTAPLEFGDTPYRALHFMPQCVQHMSGFKFVYLLPEEAA